MYFFSLFLYTADVQNVSLHKKSTYEQHFREPVENSYKTPVFVFDRKILLSTIVDYKNSFPTSTEICYSMKANAEKEVLETFYHAGINFEVASKYELILLKRFKVLPARIIYGSSVKPSNHIKEFVNYGVDRFACDSHEELLKIARYAPGARVYIRAHVNDKANSVFHMSEKFGIPMTEAIKLLVQAKELGLIPYGISFNVGSQARNPKAWARGLLDVVVAMNELLKNGITLQIINIGGGFPHRYKDSEDIPNLQEITRSITSAVKKLPYKVNLIIEPGRGLIAKSYSLIASVTEKIKRQNGYWLHLDAGVYNALLEAMAYQGSIRYRVTPLKKHYLGVQTQFILTGPACDDLDVIDRNAVLPEDIQVGDKLVIHDTGAYTFTLMTRFNGFPKPKTTFR